METITIDKKELNQIITNAVKEALITVLKDKKGLIEIMENIALSKAIDDGMKTKTIDKDKFMKKLKSRIK
ncbi:MAG TPA: hypothetical protein PKZ43_07545 [Bacteroidales bacterium]|nr:hypothetical protein [Bacteroidales bacterium]